MEGRTRGISRTGGGALKAVLSLVLALGLTPVAPVALAEENPSDDVTVVTQASGLPEADANGVIKLAEDTSVPSLTVNCDTTIDLNGKTLTYTGESTVVLANGHDLVLKNGTFKALDIKGSNDDDYARGVFNIQEGTSITLDGVKFMTNGAALFPTGDAASVTVNNSSIYAPVYCVGTNAGTADNYGVVITLTGSTFMTAIVESTLEQLPEGDSCPVMINVPGTLLMDDCTVVGTRQAVVVRGGSAKITDSRIMIVPTVGGVPEEMIGCNLYTKNDPYANGEIWKSGNEVPFGAVVLGNNSDAYKYPAAVDLEETTIFVSEKSRDRFPAVYAYDIKEKGREVSFIKADCGIGGDIKSPEGHEVDTDATGVAEVNGVGFSSLEAAISAAHPGDTVKLEDDISTASFSIPAGVTLDGDGHTITCSTENDNGAFITASKDADNVTIKDVTIDVDGKMKHGVQFYCNEGGVLDGVTVKDSYWTAVQVNGAERVKIDGCTLDPQAAEVAGAAKSPYAFIEFSMGDGVTSVPSMTVGDVDFGDADCPMVWVDDETVARIKDALKLDGATDSEVIGAIKEQITNNSHSDLGISIELVADNPVDDEIGGVPVTPPAKPSYDVIVDQPANGTVELSSTIAKEGQKVTITVKPDAGFELASLVVADEDGNALKLELNADGTYSFEMPAGDVTVHAAFECDGGELCPSHSFTDVDQDKWYHDAIDWAVENRVLNGIGGTTLMMPDGKTTRAEMAQVLWNVEGRPAATDEEAFSDVEEGDWFYGAASWAAQEGIFEGYDGKFDPDAVLTREQAAAVLMRWTEMNGGDVSGRADLSKFPDAGSVSGWAVDSVKWAVESGVLQGVESSGVTTIDAQGTATRAQVAALMMRLEA